VAAVGDLREVAESTEMVVEGDSENCITDLMGQPIFFSPDVCQHLARKR